MSFLFNERWLKQKRLDVLTINHKQDKNKWITVVN